MKKLFIGYDLGDAETSVSYLPFSPDSAATFGDADIKSAHLPATVRQGDVLPTVYGLTKSSLTIRVGIDVVKATPDMFDSIVANFKRTPSLLNSEDLATYTRHIIAFTNAVFGSKVFDNNIKLSADGCQSIVFIVGHPTKWTSEDVNIYRNILKKTIIGKETFVVDGKPYESSLVLEYESRAAFLYARLRRRETGTQWDAAAFRMLIDNGSSTTDVTAFNGRSVNSELSGGLAYLGARIIDYMIFEFCITELKRRNQYEAYIKMQRECQDFDKYLLLQCRDAKEQLFSSTLESVFIDTNSEIARIRITREQFNQILGRPVADILKNRSYFVIAPADIETVGQKTYRDVFESLLDELKRRLGDNRISDVVLSGSASQMSFLLETCKAKFGTAKVLLDDHPAQSISKGLALIGYESEKSRAFREEATLFSEKGLRNILVTVLPGFINEISSAIADVVCNEIVLPKLYEWKAGNISTLDSAMKQIASEASESRLEPKLRANGDYNKAVERLTATIVKRIEKALVDLHKRYNITIPIEKISLSGLAPNMNMVNVNTNPLTGGFATVLVVPLGAVGTAVGAVVGALVTSIVLPIVAGLLYSLATWTAATFGATIFTNLAIAITTALAGMGPGGWAVLIGAGIVTGIVGALGYTGAVKKGLQAKMPTWDMPKLVRNAIGKNKLTKAIADSKPGIQQDISSRMLEEQNKRKLIAELQKSFAPLVEKKAREIAYYMEV